MRGGKATLFLVIACCLSARAQMRSNPMSVHSFQGLQNFLNSPAGVSVLTENHASQLILSMNPNIAVHQLALGPLAGMLPKDFDDQVSRALIDPKAASDLGNTISEAYQRSIPGALAEIKSRTASAQTSQSADDLVDESRELSWYSLYGQEARNHVKDFARLAKLRLIAERQRKQLERFSPDSGYDGSALSLADIRQKAAQDWEKIIRHHKGGVTRKLPVIEEPKPVRQTFFGKIKLLLARPTSFRDTEEWGHIISEVDDYNLRVALESYPQMQRYWRLLEYFPEFSWSHNETGEVVIGAAVRPGIAESNVFEANQVLVIQDGHGNVDLVIQMIHPDEETARQVRTHIAAAVEKTKTLDPQFAVALSSGRSWMRTFSMEGKKWNSVSPETLLHLFGRFGPDHNLAFIKELAQSIQSN